MLENKKGESLVGIVVGILLLSFVVLGLYNLILYSENININFEETSVKGILVENSQNILFKLNSDGIKEGSGFYIYKNNLTNNFEIYTGATNLQYKYIDKYGEFVLTGVTDRSIYEREIILEKIDSVTNAKIYKVNVDNYYR